MERFLFRSRRHWSYPEPKRDGRKTKFPFLKACHPVPEPKKHGLGNETSSVALVTQARYDPNLIQHFMNYFPQMDVEQRSKKLGKFTDLGSADVGGKFAFTFKLLNSDCEKVSHWLDDIKKSDSVIESTTLKCTGQQQ
ncbi:hypothetical protein OSTOST_19008 [Ostertagia ostertagi]